jgi:uroporphyrinogen III methyltransferase/synthase
MRTRVYLIGTGPGVPGLITARGQRCLEAADVVIYDGTVHPRLLDLAPASAERIDVGRPAREATDQEAISYLLAEKAREGKVVARLKMGDPFLFDRGGEEALFLHEQGIPFEVVPGVPVTLSTAAYAGIPLTYPGGGDTLTFIRGHEANGGRLRVAWTHLAKLEGTVAAYGGRAELLAVAQGLLEHGRSADERAALVLRGTHVSQQTFAGSLAEVVARLEDGIDGSATLVVGKVVGLRDHLRWFDQRPLFGRRVLVTRSREHAGELVELLEGAGAEAIQAPVLRVAPLDSVETLDAAIDTMRSYDWLIFTTVNGADALIERLRARGRDARALAGPKICAVGVGSSDRLARFGVDVDLALEGQAVEAVVDALGGASMVAGTQVLLPGNATGRDSLGDALSAAGAVVTQAPAFRTVPVDDNPELDVYGQLLQRRLDVVTFTSAAAVRSFAALYGEEQVADLFAHTTVATVGPAATEAVRRLGVEPAIVPAFPSIPALVDAIRAHFQ